MMQLPTFGRARKLSNEVAVLQNEVAVHKQISNDIAALYREDVGQLENSLYEPGWIKAVASLNYEFTAEGMQQMRAICLLYALKNPLIKRGLTLRAAYVWGRGVSFVARSNGKSGQQDVQKVINDFLENDGNREAFTGAQARFDLEWSSFGTEGEIFVVLYTSPVTGAVRVRTAIADEVFRIITNPDDRSDEWFYCRRWEEEYADGSFIQKEVAHPSLNYRPASRPASLDIEGITIPIRWDAPVLHRAVNRPKSWTRGVPDAYAAIDWARAYRIFLEDLGTLMRALAQYAYTTKTPAEGAASMRRKLGSPVTKEDGSAEKSPVGRTLVVDNNTALQAVNKTGASLDASSGRPMAAMAASALEVPVTMLLADPGTAGARATAETLDQPTELPMDLRRNLWGELHQIIFKYIITEAVRAPQGPLKGKIEVDDFGDEKVTLNGKTSAIVDVRWPRMDNGDVGKLVDAIMKADSTGKVPPEVILKLLADALGIENIDAILEELISDDGTFKFPKTGPDIEPSPADLLRAGKDAAAGGVGNSNRDGASTGNTQVGGNPNGARKDGS